MLTLTRNLSEQVRIGSSTTLTLISIEPGGINVKLETPDACIETKIHRGVQYAIDVEGYRVGITVVKAVRGQARIQFDASPQLRIDRLERLEGKER